MRGIGGLANAKRFDEAQKRFPESTNIDDRRNEDIDAIFNAMRMRKLGEGGALHVEGKDITTGQVSEDWQELQEYKGRLVDIYKLSPKDLRTFLEYQDSQKLKDIGDRIQKRQHPLLKNESQQ